MLKSKIKISQIVPIVFLSAFVLIGCPVTSPEEVLPEETPEEETPPEETPPDSSAVLSELVISQGTLSPVFTVDVTSYSAWEQSTVASITVTPTAESDAAVIKVNGTTVTSGAPSGNINLSAGPDTITIEVTAEDGKTTGTYTIALYRAAGLPRTGQVTLDAEGDDGDLQRGVSWPDPRFTDNSDGTITDNLTGLMWEKTPSATARIWTAALTYANGLALAGHDDWRLPNRKELRSLVNYEESNPSTWLNGQGFSNVQGDSYWSSTTYRPSTGVAWLVILDKGTLGFSGKNGTPYYVLAVRSGQVEGDVNLPGTGQTTSYVTGDDGELQTGVAWPDPRFTDNGDGTITDNLTGLMWEKTPSATARIWTAALTYANGLTLAGYSDWHVPNATELESLINAGEADSAAWLNTQGFNNLQAAIYWSSTTYAPSATPIAWYVHMSNGSVPSNTKGGSSYVLAVRSGQ
ncbi:MAG: DUF1566 domain-containing protein [Spirochaetes bacterium]|nr:DUF1566 domain-containing protein [Spirochaetota bacterium]